MRPLVRIDVAGAASLLPVSFPSELPFAIVNAAGFSHRMHRTKLTTLSLRDSTLGRIALASASKGQRQMLAKKGSLPSRSWLASPRVCCVQFVHLGHLTRC
ncbi:uncharacterized protein PSANT_04312 [Moesziomyces antarcticus]|uniref:Uncharacterized protein n=1 Tax=Pseudozyma antarctica TaxID=84753 RepID=A0A5C3FR31_PSEA2|nr:uncharacterized protein PSANT_04312 [Moesziomyces antarcticus]